MKFKQILIPLTLAVVLLLLTFSPALAVPPLPSSFYGTVKMDGVNVPDGTTVTAWINGVQYASTTTTTIGSDSVYAMDVPGDDPATVPIEGGTAGATIVFHIGALTAAETGTWAEGTNVQRNISWTTPEYTLNVISVHGTVAKSPDQGTYHDGDEVQLTATPATGWNFTSWSGDLVSTNNPASITIHGDSTVTANYTAITFTISGNAGIGGAAINYTDGTPQSVTADGAGDFIFTVSYNWSGTITPVKTGYSFTEPFLSFTNVLANQTGANFSANPNSYTLSVFADGTGTGTVGSEPTGICGTLPCSHDYQYGTQISLTAIPTVGGYDRFLQWTGGGCGSINPCVFTLTGNTTITVTFDKAIFADVPFTHPRWAYIEALYQGGYTAGCTTTGVLKYCPDKSMSRAESAVFMLRGNFGSGYVPPVAPWTTFADNWSPGTWAEKWAEGMWKEGLTAGCQSPADNPVKKFCPWDNFPRVQGAVFGLRLMHGISYLPPAATGTVLGDMTDVNFYGTKWAEQAYKDGLILACGTLNGLPKFCPNNLLSRAESAYMIVIAKNLPLP